MCNRSLRCVAARTCVRLLRADLGPQVVQLRAVVRAFLWLSQLSRCVRCFLLRG